MKTVICSHGFGVDKTGRGLFTDIAAAFPDYTFVMFDYNSFDDAGNMTVQPLGTQVELLNEHIAEADGEVVLLCHSQGCVVAAMAALGAITNLVFLAPPDNLDIPRFARIFGKREGTVFNPEGMSSIPRRDGTTTYIGKDYLASVAAADVPALFAEVAQEHKLTIIKAASDEIVGRTDFPNLPAELITIPGDHNFTGAGRQGLIETLKTLL